MAIDILTEPQFLVAVRNNIRLSGVPDFFWKSFFPTSIYSADEKIRFATLNNENRKLAPFVMPTSQGKPIFERGGGTVEEFTPAYIKVKDPVRPTEMRNFTAQEVLVNNGRPPSFEDRYRKCITEIVAAHLKAINMQKAWLAARAFIDARVTISYLADQGAKHPEVTIDFGRDPSLEETLSGTFWDDPTYDIIGMLSDMANTMTNIEFGGLPTTLILGSEVLTPFLKNEGLKDLLDTTYRGGESTSFERGLVFTGNVPLTRIGRLGGIGGTLEVFMYRDNVQNNDNSEVPIYNSKDVLLIAPGAGDNIYAHGAIYDVDAYEQGGMALEIFAKSFKTDDPGELYIMHQCSPLPINVYPNRCAKMRVLA